MKTVKGKGEMEMYLPDGLRSTASLLQRLSRPVS